MGSIVYGTADICVSKCVCVCLSGSGLWLTGGASATATALESSGTKTHIILYYIFVDIRVYVNAHVVHGWFTVSGIRPG